MVDELFQVLQNSCKIKVQNNDMLLKSKKKLFLILWKVHGCFFLPLNYFCGEVGGVPKPKLHVN